MSLFAAAQAPVLFSRDLRYRSIVLYLARPLPAYVIALTRWASLATALLVFTVLPLLVLYAGGLLAGLDVSEQTTDLLKAVALLLLVAAMLAGITGFISAVSLRRGFAVVGSIVALVVVTGVVTAVQAITSEQDADQVGVVAGLASPWSLDQRPRVRVGRRGHGLHPARRRVGRGLPRRRRPRRGGRPRRHRGALPQGGFAMSTLVLDSVSRWFGNVVAVNDVSLTIAPGVTGLLGPNGAGKTTLMAMMTGFLAPSAGTVTLDGEPVWRHTEAYRRIGLVPERELSFGYLTGRQFVRANADLHRLPDAAAATERILAEVDMVEPAARRLDTYSKGMRQRVKIAAALVHDPAVLLLDEPFNGVDPRQRMHLMDLLHRLGDEGRTVLFSSHILEEVERLARHIEVVVSGRHAASGDFGAIRRLMTDRPVQYAVVSSDDRALATLLIAQAAVRAVRLRPDGGLDVEVDDLGSFAVGLPQWARAAGLTLYDLSPSDESLESVFAYLVAR